MTAALRLGGGMLAEEPYFEIITAVDEAHPLAEQFNKTISSMFGFLSEAGIMHSVFGRTLPSLLDRVGLVDVEHDGTTSIARGGNPESRNWLSVLDHLGEYLVSQGGVQQT